MARGDWSGARAAWQAALAAHPEKPSPEVLHGLAEVHLALAEDAAAATFYERLCAVAPGQPAGWVGVAKLASLRADWDAAIAAWTACIGRFDSRLELWWLQWLADAQRRAGRTADAEATAAMIQARRRGLPAAAPVAGTAGAEDPLRTAHRLVEAGRFDEFLTLVPTLPPAVQASQLIREAVQVVRQVKASGLIDDFVAHNVDFSAHRSLLAWRAPTPTDRAIVAFTGGGQRFWISIEAMHRILATFGCHLIYLRDYSSGLYLEGAPDLGLDYDGMVEAVRRAAADLGATRLFCLGTSAGGYGAMRFALDLPAEAALSFSGLTDPAAVYSRAARLQRLTGRSVDLRELRLAARHPPRMIFCYGDAHDADRAAAERMADLPGVRLVPAEGFAQHGAITWFLRNGRFPALVEALLGDAAA